MADYPKDEFDDLPATGRKGAHRRDGGPTSQAGALALIAILAIAALLLVFGAINIIRTSAGDPEEKIAEPTATAEPTSEETTEEPSVDIDAVGIVADQGQGSHGVTGSARRRSAEPWRKDAPRRSAARHPCPRWR